MRTNYFQMCLLYIRLQVNLVSKGNITTPAPLKLTNYPALCFPLLPLKAY